MTEYKTTCILCVSGTCTQRDSHSTAWLCCPGPGHSRHCHCIESWQLGADMVTLDAWLHRPFTFLKTSRTVPLPWLSYKNLRSRLFGSALATSRPLKGVVTTSALQPSSPHCHGEHLSHHSPAIRCRAGTGPMQSPSRQKVDDRQDIFKGMSASDDVDDAARDVRLSVHAHKYARIRLQLTRTCLRRHVTPHAAQNDLKSFITDWLIVSRLRCKCTSWSKLRFVECIFCQIACRFYFLSTVCATERFAYLCVSLFPFLISWFLLFIGHVCCFLIHKFL